MQVIAAVLPATTDDEYDRALLAGQAYLHSVGVVGWQDAIIGSYAGMDDPGPAYARAARRGELTAEVIGALWWDRDQGLEQVDFLLDRRSALSHGRFRATSVKIMQDGVAENGTAALGGPYLDADRRPTTNAGRSLIEPTALRAAIKRLDAEGFQVHVHAIGDRAVRETLDAFAGAVPGGDRRHHIAHLQVIHPDDVPRFASLDVAANLQALWACLDDQMVDLTLPFLDAERARWQYPFGDLQRAGARLVLGSDWPVSSPDPAGGDPCGRESHRLRRAGQGRRGALPARATSECRRCLCGVHLRLGMGQPPRRGRPRGAGPHRGSGRSRPRSLRGSER